MNQLTTPHRERQSMVKTIFLITLLGIVLCSLYSCTALKDPCKERRGISGYGYKAN